MEHVALEKTFTIKLDVIKGEITIENLDEIAYCELLGMIEYAKMMVIQDWLEKR